MGHILAIGPHAPVVHDHAWVAPRDDEIAHIAANAATYRDLAERRAEATGALT